MVFTMKCCTLMTSPFSVLTPPLSLLGISSKSKSNSELSLKLVVTRLLIKLILVLQTLANDFYQKKVVKSYRHL